MPSKTEMFRTHHTQVRSLVARIEALLDQQAITRDPVPVADVVRELFGKLGVHLSIEDATLYPRMIAHGDARLRQAAESFQREMGGLKADFDAYRHQWPGPTTIARDPQAFVAATRALLSVLKRRIDREDVDLYDLYDRVA